MLQWVRMRTGRSSGTGRIPRPNVASRPWSVVASKTIASASARIAAAIAAPSSDRSPTASYAAIIRSTAHPRLTAVGRAFFNALAEPRRVARRAYAPLSRIRAAVRAIPMAATWPIAGAPRMIMFRMA